MELKTLVDELIAKGKKTPFAKWEQEIVKRLRADVPHYSWVGFYWQDQNDLALGAWDGPAATEHERIPVGKGLCGRAAALGETVLVDDVDEAGEYLACFPSTKSEIVVPVFLNGEVIGEIDIDSDSAAAFGDEDRQELERLARGIEELLHV